MSLKRNTTWNLLGSGLPLLAAAALIPYCLRELGNESFGVLTLIWALIGYFSLFDFGVGRALTFSVSKLNKELGNEKEMHATINAGLLLTTLTGLAGMLIFLAIAHPLTHTWLKISIPLQADAQLAFQIAAIGIIPTTLNSGLRGAMEGLDRFDASNLNKIFLGFCMFVLPALSISLHGNALWPIALYLVSSRIMTLFIGMHQLRRHFHARRAAKTTFEESMAKTKGLFSYGAWLTVSSVISPLMVFGDRFFVSSLTGAAQLSSYAIPQEMLFRVLLIPTAICGALLPLLSTLHNNETLRIEYKKNYKRLGIIMLGICVLTACFMYPVLYLWISKEFAQQSLSIAVIFIVGIFINSLALMPYTLLHALGKPKITAQFHVAEFFVYIAVLYVLTTHFGLVGAAVSWVFRVTLDFVLLHFAARRELCVSSES